MRRVAVLLAAVGVAVTASAAGTAGTSRDAAIKPGKGIGKVELGMTLAQVKRALGGSPFGVVRRTNHGARGRYVEYTWEVGALVIRTWTVGLRSTRRNGPLRVVRVATGVPGHRTPEGLGVGSRPGDIFRAFPDAACALRHDPEKGWYGNWIVVEHPSGGMTAFGLEIRFDPPNSVVQVLVQRSWLNFYEGQSQECPREWRVT